MGVSIHGSAYRVDQLVAEMEKFIKESGGYREGALPASDFLSTVASDFGVILDGYFLTVYNEYYEDYNPQQEFFNVVMTYYFPDRRDEIEDYDIEFYPTRSEYFAGGANAEETLETHFEDEFGWENGKFNRDEDEDE